MRSDASVDAKKSLSSREDSRLPQAAHLRRYFSPPIGVTVWYLAESHERVAEKPFFSREYCTRNVIMGYFMQGVHYANVLQMLIR